MIRVYIASKICYADQFKGYREAWRVDGIDLHARWFDQAHLEVHGEPTPGEFTIFWLCDEEDVMTSKALIVYGAPNDHLRGALVEVGIAIAFGILVIVVGDSPDYGTWQHHPGVVRAESFEKAKEMILFRFGNKKDKNNDFNRENRSAA